MKFDHSQKDFFSALNINKESADYLKKLSEDGLSGKTTISETIVFLIEEIQKKSLGDSHEITEFEMFLLVCGFLLGTLRSQKSPNGMPEEIASGLKKALLKHIGEDESEDGDNTLKISINQGKTEKESFAMFKGKTDVETGMEVINLLRKIQKQREKENN